MTRQTILTILIALFVLSGCEKGPENLETNSNGLIEGWEISKTIYDFEINPRDLFFIDSEVGFVVRKCIPENPEWWRDVDEDVFRGLHSHSIIAFFQ